LISTSKAKLFIFIKYEFNIELSDNQTSFRKNDQWYIFKIIENITDLNKIFEFNIISIIIISNYNNIIIIEKYIKDNNINKVSKKSINFDTIPHKIQIFILGYI
jgi:UDP-N-acetylenolpyruvoylglucosamine reductase